MKWPLVIFGGAFVWLLAGTLPASAMSCLGTTYSDSTYTIIVHESLPPFSVHQILKETTKQYSPWCYELQIGFTGQDTPTQFINGETSGSAMASIEFLDLNFDNHLDIQVMVGCGANGVNCGYAIYLFSIKKKEFVLSNDFSEITGGVWSDFNAEKKEITTYGDLGCMRECWSRDTYRVEEDSLILIRSVRRSQDDETPGGYVIITEELIEGKLTVVSKKEEGSQYGDQ